MKTLFPLAAGFALTTLSVAACPQYDAVVAAVQDGDVATAKPLYGAISVSADCDDALQEWVGDFLARESFATALASDDPAVSRAALNDALAFEKHWRSYAALADLDWDQQDYASAAAHYQLALNELIEGDQTHDASDAEIARVHQMATSALALADTVVEMPKTRSGTAGGVFVQSIRGFEVEEVPLPITFEYNSTTFDAAGESYALALADHLIAMAPPEVFLGGHTDPIGGEDYNFDLSVSRAEALAAFLTTNGYGGSVNIIGFGESRLPPAPPGIVEGSEDHYRIARRVSFSVQ